jgi:hypothetical protein
MDYRRPARRWQKFRNSARHIAEPLGRQPCQKKVPSAEVAQLDVFGLSHIFRLMDSQSLPIHLVQSMKICVFIARDFTR